MNKTSPLRSCSHALSTEDSHFGWLQDSSHLQNDPQAMRRVLAEEGYLFLRGFFDEDEILAARKSLVERLDATGYIEPGTDPMEAFVAHEKTTAFQPDLAKDNPEVDRIVFHPDLYAQHEKLFGESVLAFSYKWLRAVGPGNGTTPHCDWVYMNRGSRRLLTTWIPYGEVSLELGGLMLLERSHLQAHRIANYLEHDVDTYCENNPKDVDRVAKKGGINRGHLTNNPSTLREKFGGRWLTAEYRPSDIVIFNMTLVHASLDNQTDRIRLSSDTRYQPGSEPADERWIGQNPIGHSIAGKRGRIC